MERPQRSIDDEQLDQLLGNLLRFGVVLATTVVVVGGIMFIQKHGQETPNLAVFRGEPPAFRIIPDIFQGTLALQGRAIIQLGVLLLILTPIARVGLSLFAFAKQRDRTYIVVTLIVLVVLLHSLVAAA